MHERQPRNDVSLLLSPSLSLSLRINKYNLKKKKKISPPSVSLGQIKVLQGPSALGESVSCSFQLPVAVAFLGWW